MLITNLIVSGVALLLFGITGTLWVLDHLGSIQLPGRAFFWIVGTCNLASVMAVVFIGNTCVYIATMS